MKLYQLEICFLQHFSQKQQSRLCFDTNGPLRLGKCVPMLHEAPRHEEMEVSGQLHFSTA
jgi:hypothetical protein